MSGNALALGLGELAPQSYLGEPLVAAAPLLDVRSGMAPDDIQVRIIHPAEAAELGVELAYIPPGVAAQVDASVSPWQVRVTTPRIVKEPYLVLLLEVSWQKGVVYREYSLLLDLPGRQLPQPTPPPAAASPPTAASARATLPPAPALEMGKQYPVQRGDTLWAIAERLRGNVGTAATNAELQAWLLSNNPEAFLDGDVDQLRAGATLRLPASDALSASDTMTAGDPMTKVGARPAAASAADSGASSDEPTAAAVTDTASPTVPKPATVPSEAGAVADTSQDTAAGIEDEQGLLVVGAGNRDDKTRELIDLLVRENESLKQRMGELENSEYLNTLKDLVLLQREQIAELRKQLNLPDDPNADDADLVLAKIAAGERAELANRTRAAEAGNGSVDAGGEDALVEAAPLAQVVPAGDPIESEQPSRPWLYGVLLGLGGLLAGGAIWLLTRRRQAPAEDMDAFYPPPPAAPPAPSDEPSQAPTFSAAAPANRAADVWLREQVGEQPAEGDALAVSAEELAEIEAELAPVKGRPTDVVKRDIARKSEDYRAGRHRRAENLGALELTEMIDLSGQTETDPAKGLHRAMMLCDFKQFDQARALLKKLPLAAGSRELAEALAEVDARERAQWSRS